MIGYILKRLVSAIPVLIGISIIVFIIMALIPGDPATAILGSFATPENVEKLKSRYPDGEFDVYYSENRKEGDL